MTRQQISHALEEALPSRLAAYLERGCIFLEGNTYVGKAADGVEVQLGQVGEEATIESYLTERGPENW